MKRYREEDLSKLERNLVAALFRLEKSQTFGVVRQVVSTLGAWLSAPEQMSLRLAFTEWIKQVLLPLRLPGVEIPEVRDLGEVETMLAEHVTPWTEQWKQEGLQEGLQQAREHERQLLARLAELRFGEDCSAQLSVLLAAVDDSAQLMEIGEWIVRSPDGNVFIAHIKELLGR